MFQHKKHLLLGLGSVILLALLGSWVYRTTPWNTTQFTKQSVTMAYRDYDDGMAMGMAEPMPNDMVMEQSAEYYGEPPSSPVPPPGRADTAQVAERLIIKTADVQMVVDSVPQVLSALSDMVVEQGGFVVTQSMNKEANGYITVRIPSGIFDQALQAVAELGDVTSQSVRGQDVTEEYVDVEAQLTNLRRTEAQFLEIMTRATEVEDVLAVQRELSTVRSQIDRLEGRKTYLEQSATLSTITVSVSRNPELSPVVEPDTSWKPVAVLLDAVRSLRGFGIGIANAIIWFVVYAPVWILLLLIAWLFRRKLSKSERS